VDYVIWTQGRSKFCVKNEQIYTRDSNFISDSKDALTLLKCILVDIIGY